MLRVRARLLSGAWGVWATLLLGIYFRQAWRLLAAGPAAWAPFLRAAVALLGPLILLTGLILVAASAAPKSRGRVLLVILLGVAAGVAALALTRVSLASALAVAERFPAAREAASRALGAVAGGAAILLAAQVAGEAILRLVGAAPTSRAEALLYRTATGLGGVAYLALALAGLGLYTPLHLRILVGALLLLGAAWFAWRSRTPDPATGVLFAPARASGHGSVSTRSAPTERGTLIWKTIVVLALLVALTGALAPEREYDALWYHLAFPRAWLERGVLFDQPQEYVALYPMTWELLYGAAISLGGPISAKLLHFSMLPLLGLLVFQATRRLIPGASPWTAVAFFVTIPTLHWEATTAYIDLAFMLHAGLAGYALYRYAAERTRGWLLLSVLQFGLALATKHLGFLALAVGTGGLGLFLWRRAGLRRALETTALVAILSLLIPSVWYVRSWRATGNPVFPEFFQVFGAPAGRWDATADAALSRFEARFGRPRTLPNLLTLPWDVTVHAARYGGAAGPALLLFLPVLAAARRPPGLPLLLVALAYGALWASPLSSFQFRFLLPAALPLAPLAARALSRLAGLLRAAGFRQARPVLSGCVAALLVLNLPPFIPLHETDRVGWKGWLTHVVRGIPRGVVLGARSEDRYLAVAVPSYRAWQFINTRLPLGARILAFGGGDNYYSRRERIGINAPAARAAVWGAPAGMDRATLQALAALKVSHILVDKQEAATFPPDSVAIVAPAFQRRWLAPLYADDRFVLYRIRWEVTRVGP